MTVPHAPASTAPPALAVHNIQIVYGGAIEAVRDVSLEVRPGQIVALLGSNGAGKSSVLKAISGVLDAEDGEIEKGSIHLFGEAIERAPAPPIVKNGMAPLIVAEIFSSISRRRETSGLTILLVEQNASRALAIADYAYIMENGRVVLDGTSEQLRRNQDVREFYLGLSSQTGRTHMKDVKHYKRRKRWLS